MKCSPEQDGKTVYQSVCEVCKDEEEEKIKALKEACRRG